MLYMNARKFSSMDPLDQLSVVHDSLKDLPICSVTFSVRGGDVHVQDIQVIRTSSILRQKRDWQTPRTPRRGSP